MSTWCSMIGRTSIKCHLIDLASPMPDASTRIKNTSLYIDMAITQSRNDPHFKRFDAIIRTSEKCIIQVSSDPVSILTSPNTAAAHANFILWVATVAPPQHAKQPLFCKCTCLLHKEICFVCNRVRFFLLSFYLCFFFVISSHWDLPAV